MANGLPLERLPQVPATALLLLGAIAVTARGYALGDYDPWVLDVRAFHGEPWRLLTSALPHGDILHLAFNVYWAWHLGSRVEERYGTPATLGLFAVLHLVALCAEYAVLDGGIGLSGIGYGLVTFLYVRSTRDRRLADAVDDATMRLFGGWFVICVVLTATGLMAIANIAHAMGAVAGAVIGLAVDVAVPARRQEAVPAVVGAVALVLLTLVGSTFARPYVNLSARAGDDAAYVGYVAHTEHRLEDAVTMYRISLEMDATDADTWWNLALAEGALGHADATREAMDEAVTRAPDKYADQAAQYRP